MRHPRATKGHQPARTAKRARQASAPARSAPPEPWDPRQAPLRAHAVALVLLLGASVLCAFLPQGSSQATTILAYEPPVLLMALGAFSLLARAPKALWATPLIAGGALLALGALAEQRGREGEYLILLACALGALLMASAWALRHERRARQQ